MPYLIFIRHAQKKYKNNKGPNNLPRHDPPILDGMKRLILKKIITYFNTYGKADKIICSPFLRTRQTAKIIKNILPPETPLVVEKDIEEFLGFQKPIGQIADLDQETLKYTRPKIGTETISQLGIRAYQFYQSIKESKENIIIITHGFLINKLAEKLGLHIKYIDELEGIIIKNNNAQKLIKFNT